eukprot:jgi/Chlat1/8940/Chrsp94S08249
MGWWSLGRLLPGAEQQQQQQGDDAAAPLLEGGKKRGGRRKHMPVHDRLTLSPWDKYWKHGRTPVKFMLQIALTILVSLQVSWLNGNGSYMDRTQATLTRMLLPEGTPLSRNQGTLSTFDDFGSLLSHAVDSYSNLDRFVGWFKPAGLASIVVEPVKGGGGPGVAENVTRKEVVGPFETGDYRALRQAVAQAKSATLSMTILNLDSKAGVAPACWMWEYSASFDFATDRSVIRFGIGFVSQMARKMSHCTSYPHAPLKWMNRLRILSMVVSAVAMWSLALVSRQIHRHVSYKLYSKAKHLYSGANAGRGIKLPVFWEELSSRDKLRFFNLWSVLTLLFNIACIASCCLLLVPSQLSDINHHWWVQFTTGVSVLLGWIAIVQYFEFDKELAVFLSAIEMGCPYILRLIIATGPVFIGYAFFAWTMFGSFAEAFIDFGSAAVTLFCIANGDNIHDTFDQMSDGNRLIARLFVSTFVIFFIYAVLNVFIFVIEDAVQSTKARVMAKQMRSWFTNNSLLDDTLMQELLNPLNRSPNASSSSHSNQAMDGLMQSPALDALADSAQQNDGEFNEFSEDGINQVDPEEGNAGLTHQNEGERGREYVYDATARQAMTGEGASPEGGPLHTNSFGRGLHPMDDLISRMLEHVFYAQERVAQQHMELFNNKLEAIQQEHFRRLSKSQEHTMEVLEKRLRALTSSGSNSQQQQQQQAQATDSTAYPRGRQAWQKLRASINPSWPLPATPAPTPTRTPTQKKLSRTPTSSSSRPPLSPLDVGLDRSLASAMTLSSAGGINSRGEPIDDAELAFKLQESSAEFGETFRKLQRSGESFFRVVQAATAAAAVSASASAMASAVATPTQTPPRSGYATPRDNSNKNNNNNNNASASPVPTPVQSLASALSALSLSASGSTQDNEQASVGADDYTTKEDKQG